MVHSKSEVRQVIKEMLKRETENYAQTKVYWQLQIYAKLSDFADNLSGIYKKE